MAAKTPLNDRSAWIETSATVLNCRYQFARMNTLTAGIQTGGKFQIVFEYYAHGRLHSGEFQSAVAIPQNETLVVRYNPLRPQENTYSDGPQSVAGAQWIAVGVAGSVVLSLLWLGLVRGCS